MSSKLPIRTCVGCLQKKPKDELLRLIRLSEGKVEVDFRKKKWGRGAYLCPDLKCLQLAARKNRLERAFRANVSKQAYQELETILAHIGVTLNQDSVVN